MPVELILSLRRDGGTERLAAQGDRMGITPEAVSRSIDLKLRPKNARDVIVLGANRDFLHAGWIKSKNLPVHVATSWL